MDHPDDQHSLLDPTLPHDAGLAVLTAGFDQEAPSVGDGSPSQRDQQQQQQQHASSSSANGGQPQQQQTTDGYPHPDASYGFSTQGEHGEGDLLQVDGRPPASDDGHGATGGGDAGSMNGGGSGKRRRSGPPGGVELDLSTPEGQAKKKQRAARAAYMRDYRKKKSLGKAGGKSEDGMGVNTGATYDEMMYDADKLKQLDLVDPSISGSNGSGFGGYGLAVNLHNAADGAFHDDLGLSQAPYAPRFTTFNHPAQLGSLPTPRLKFLFHVEIELDVTRDVGEAPLGRRSFTGYKGGQFEGPGSRGTVAPGGGETSTSDTTTSETQMEGRFVLTTSEGENLLLTSSGVRTGPKDVLDSLAGGNGQLQPTAYTCRHTLRIETGEGRYKWLNKAMCVASAGRAGNMAVFDVYQLY